MQAQFSFHQLLMLCTASASVKTLVVQLQFFPIEMASKITGMSCIILAQLMTRGKNNWIPGIILCNLCQRNSWENTFVFSV